MLELFEKKKDGDIAFVWKESLVNNLINIFSESTEIMASSLH